MFNMISRRWIGGAALALALAANLVGASGASAHTLALPAAVINHGGDTQTGRDSGGSDALPAQVQATLAVQPAGPLSPGTAFTYQLSVTNAGPGPALKTTVTLPLDLQVAIDGYSSSDPTSFVQSLAPEAVTIQFNNLAPGSTTTAQISAHVRPTAAPLTLQSQATVTWDDNAIGRSSLSNMVPLGVSGQPQMSPLQSTVAGPVAAGTFLTFTGSAYGSSETVSLWLNMPDGSVMAIDAVGKTDDQGNFSYTLDTTGMASGSYSLVAHGQTSGVEGVAAFKIQ